MPAQVVLPGARRAKLMMHWFRSRSRLGSCLALFVLAFQLAVSIGHVSYRRILVTEGFRRQRFELAI
jgi:hypothetical protein